MKTQITHVAILFSDVIYALPKPSRHHNVLRIMWEQLGDQCIDDGVQGFLDADGVFLNRYEAKIRATETGQLLSRASELDILFSEDIW